MWIMKQSNKALEEKGQAALPPLEIALLERIDSLLDMKEAQATAAGIKPTGVKPALSLPTTIKFGRSQ